MIQFYLKAVPDFKGTLRVLEFWKLPCSGGSGFTEGMVDEDIRKQNRKTYEAWHAWVEQNAETLYPAIKEEYLKGRVAQ